MRRIAMLAEGRFHWQGAKTAVGVIRYSPDTVVAVIDSIHAREDAGAVLGDPSGPARGIPVVADVSDALAYKPDTFMIGLTPLRGLLPGEGAAAGFELDAARPPTVSRPS